MRTIEITAYKVDELTSKAQEKAHAKWLENFDYPFSQDNYNSLKRFEKIFPVNVTKWGYGNGYHLDFSFTDNDDIERLKGFRLARYIWNNYKNAIYQGKYYGKLVPTFPSGEKIPVSIEYPIGERHVLRHSKILLSDACPLTGYCVDNDPLQPIYNFLKSPDESVTFYDLMNDCLDGWIMACNADYEDRQTIESFIDDAKANEWEFTEDGEMI